MIAIGGDDKKVQLYQLEMQEDGATKLKEGGAELAMCFDSPVTKLEYYGKGG